MASAGARIAGTSRPLGAFVSIVSGRISAAIVCTSLIACDRGPSPAPSISSSATSPPSSISSSATSPPSSSIPSSSSPSIPSSCSSIPSSSSAPGSWLGEDVDPTVALPVTLAFGSAKLRVPADWKHIRITNGMSGDDEGVLAFVPAPPQKGAPPRLGPIDKSVAILLTMHGAVDDSLLDYGGPARFGLAADAGARAWSAPSKATAGPSAAPIEVLRGEGSLGREEADLWQVRRKLPTKRGFGTTVLLLAAVRRSAPAPLRRALLASLASFDPG